MTPLPWSHSTLEKFKACPKQYYHTKVAKDVVETSGEAAEWGNLLHKAFEDALLNETPLPDELRSYQHYIDQIMKFSGDRYVEHKLGVTRAKMPCDFSSLHVWARGIIDVLVVRGDRAFILDHKSGSVKPSKQLMLNSLLVFANFPKVQRCTTVFYWLKNNTMTPGHHERKDAAALWSTYDADLYNYNKAFETDTWVAKQSGLCAGYCPVESCQFWREKRK